MFDWFHQWSHWDLEFSLWTDLNYKLNFINTESLIFSILGESILVIYVSHWSCYFIKMPVLLAKSYSLYPLKFFCLSNLWVYPLFYSWICIFCPFYWINLTWIVPTYWSFQITRFWFHDFLYCLLSISLVSVIIVISSPLFTWCLIDLLLDGSLGNSLIQLLLDRSEDASIFFSECFYKHVIVLLFTYKSVIHY